VRETGGGTGFALERDYDLSTAVLPGDKVISALPDWGGRLWFASTGGVVGTVDPQSGAVRSRPLGEKIANSFAVEDTGAVYVVTDAVLYRLEAGADGIPRASGARPTRTPACRSRASRAPGRARRRR
jgi:streptogramin lyase